MKKELKLKPEVIEILDPLRLVGYVGGNQTEADTCTMYDTFRNCNGNSINCDGDDAGGQSDGCGGSGNATHTCVSICDGSCGEGWDTDATDCLTYSPAGCGGSGIDPGGDAGNL